MYFSGLVFHSDISHLKQNETQKGQILVFKKVQRSQTTNEESIELAFRHKYTIQEPDCVVVFFPVCVLYTCIHIYTHM